MKSIEEIKQNYRNHPSHILETVVRHNTEVASSLDNQPEHMQYEDRHSMRAVATAAAELLTERGHA